MCMSVWKILSSVLNPELESYLKNASFVENPKYHSIKRTLDLKINTDNVLPFDIYEQIVHQLKVHFQVHVNVYIQARKTSVSVDELYLYVEKIIEKNASLRCFRFLHPYMENETVCFSTKDDSRLIDLNKGLPQLQEECKAFGIHMDMKCMLVFDDDEIETNVIEIPEKPKEEKRTYAREAKVECKICELQVGMKNIVFEGHVFSLENKVLKSKKTLQQLYISDYEDAIIAKRFESARLPLEELESIKNGQTVRITGDVIYDTFLKCDTVMINKLETISESKRMDTAMEKRTEWHVHSTFSEMDGVCAIEEYIQTAYDWGMDAIGICDHQVVQAFPMAQHKIEALNKKNPNKPFKMLYGCEMLMVDPEYKIVYNNNHTRL